MQDQSISAVDVISTYKIMLGRVPESPAAISSHLAQSKNQAELVKNISVSPEFLQRVGGLPQQASPFLHPNSNVDVGGIVRAHTRHDRRPDPNYLVNFLNVKIPPKVMSLLHDRAGQLDEVPLPANFHADMAEWAAALRAVDLSGPKFTMIELGCGWGCWMNNTGVVAAWKGKQIDLVGVEGDSLHIEYAIQTFAANNIEPGQYSILRGIASAESGIALFPRRVSDEERWGYAPRFGVSKEESIAAVASGDFDSLMMVSMVQVIGNRPRIDLLHMDIQGGEADLVAKAIEILNERVAYLVIGTHSRSLEGRLMDTLLGAGWFLEIERPAIFNIPGGQPQTTVDGVQGWRNLRLLPT